VSEPGGLANSGMEPSGAPSLRIVNPDATDEEVAAVIAVFGSLGGATTPPPKPPREWAANARKMRSTLRRGPGAWRASGLPHR
jgi:hypothetical protein